MHEKIDAFVDAQFDTYIDKVKEICAQPSISARSEGVLECSNIVQKLLEAHGYEVTRVETPGQPVIVGKAKGQSPRTLLCYNHYDVQPPEPLELWESPPFEPTIRDGALYARGAKDDKGEFIARLFAIDAAREANGGELPCNITFVVEGEEEIGSPTIAEFVRQNVDLLACDGSIWEEGGIDSDERLSLSLGARGILGVELSLSTMRKDAHSGGADILPNAAWRLLRVLESLKGPDEEIKIAGFYDDAREPSEIDLKIIEAMPDYEKTFRETFGVKQFVRGASGKELNHMVFKPTCNIEGITTGYQGIGLKTVIPADARVKLDFRLVPDQSPEDIFKKLRAHLDNQGFSDVEAQYVAGMWPHKSPADDPFVQLTAKTAEAVYGKPTLLRPMNGGSSPIYAFAKPLGNIPVVSCGVGYWNNQVHSPNEHVRLKDFKNAARHIGRIVMGFGEI